MQITVFFMSTAPPGGALFNRDQGALQEPFARNHYDGTIPLLAREIEPARLS
jgi:hypothetical protein